ncbi:hypothetical protein GCM10010406_21700 [Streptomyces thermolineatus]|uniref:Cellulose-binding protein n=1 Tax=Streptomyces thermolineatus TaxID=44033 RepID=A0ABN3LLL6_9ACTN
MSDRNTEAERLDQTRARAEAATPGPWGTYRDLNGAYTIQARVRTTAHGMVTDGAVAEILADSDDQGYSDAQFIAEAREDVPFLLAEVERLRAERDALQTSFDTAIRGFNASAIQIAELRDRVAELTAERDRARAAAVALEQELASTERETRDRIVADLEAAIDGTRQHAADLGEPAMEARILGYRAAQRIVQGDAEAVAR